MLKNIPPMRALLYALLLGLLPLAFVLVNFLSKHSSIGDLRSTLQGYARDCHAA